MANTTAEVDQRIASMDEEQLPVGEHELHGSGHFAGLYSAENVAGTEFVFGATFVILGASMVDVLIGMAVGNLLAVLTFRFFAASMGVRTRMSVYTYLERVAGGLTSKLFNGLNALVFAVISAAMITVSATAFSIIFGFSEQTEAYPTSLNFIILAAVFGSVVVLVAAYGFHTLAEFATICAPWLMIMFATGGIVMLPAVAESVTGSTVLNGFGEFVAIGGETIFTGQTPSGAAGITLLGIIGYTWAANSFAHAGLVDMSLFRYAKKGWYGYLSGFGMFLGHYMAWISAGFMGAAAAAIVSTSITDISPGTVALQALGYTGLAVVVVGGWTTANANLYRSGLAGQGVLTSFSRQRVTLIIGVLVVVASLFPFIYRGYLNLVTYAGITIVPIGGILIAEHFILPRLGMTKFWARYKGVRNIPALLAWGIALGLVGTAIALGLMPVYYGFPPAFVISAALYLLFARMMGAADEYPEGKAADEFFQERVEVFLEKEAANAPDVDTKDYRKLTRVLRVIWVVDLAVIFAVALFVLLASPDVSTYEANQNLFYWVTGTGTVIYFVTGYWELRRRKSHAKRALDNSAAERGRAEEPEPAQL